MANEFDLGLIYKIIGIDKAHRQIGQMERATSQSMDKSQKAVNNFGNSFIKLGATISSVRQVASSLQSTFSFVFGGFVEFDKNMRSLEAITGATGDTLEFFRQKALAVGRSTSIGASEAVNAMELIGSAKPELLANAEALAHVTDQAIILAEASGLTLPEAADALTGAMNQLGAGADQAARFINVLGAGAQAGAAAVPLVTQALLKFGAVAKSSNVSIEESVGLIETLAENGLKGAEAGTALRNILLKLSAVDVLPARAQDALRRAGVNINILKDNSIPLIDRLREVSKVASDSSAIVEVFGTENAVAAANVLLNTERVEELTKAVDASNKVAEEQADINRRSLANSLVRLKNTWESLRIEIAGRLAPTLSRMIVIFNKVAGFIQRNQKAVLTFISILGGLALGIKAVTAAQRAWNFALRANPIGLLISGLTLAIAAIASYTTATQAASGAQKELNEAQTASIKLTTATLPRRHLFSPERANEIEKVLDQIAIGVSTGEELRAELVKEVAEIQAESQRQIDKFADLVSQGKTQEANVLKRSSNNFAKQLSGLRTAIGEIDKAVAKSKLVNSIINGEDGGGEGPPAITEALFGIEEISSGKIQSSYQKVFDDLDKMRQEFLRKQGEIAAAGGFGEIGSALIPGGASASASEEAAASTRAAQKKALAGSVENLKELGFIGKGFANMIDNMQSAGANMEKLIDLAGSLRERLMELANTIKMQLANSFGDLAFNLGKAIAAGGGFKTAFQKFAEELVVMIPKYAGMFLLQSAVIWGPTPAGFAAAAAGLALLGFSGIASGLLDRGQEGAGAGPSALTAPGTSQLVGLSAFGAKAGDNLNFQTQVQVFIGEDEVDNVVHRSQQRFNSRRGR